MTYEEEKERGYGPIIGGQCYGSAGNGERCQLKSGFGPWNTHCKEHAKEYIGINFGGPNRSGSNKMPYSQ